MTFDFKCKSCDHVYEAIIIKELQPVCTKCNSKKAKKLFSAPTIMMNPTSDAKLRSKGVIL
tara:strand:+ start:256 stop:438 length:183 start_codon:yes stop_codon:yes gene_type:complete